MQFVLRLVIALVVTLVVTVFGLRLWFGDGAAYKDLTTPPAIGEPGLETVLEHHSPIGALAVSATGRVFFATHPDVPAEGPRVFEWRDGVARPFPAAATQAALLDTPAGLAIDRFERLWIIDPASHGFGRPRLMAVDLATGLVTHEHVFPRAIAPRGSFLNDLEIDPAGRMAYIADASIWRRNPAVVVYDSLTRESSRRLEGHAALLPQGWVPGTDVREMRYVAGLVPYRPGLHGLALDPAGRWLYLGAMANDTLYRVPATVLADPGADAGQLAAAVEPAGVKPLSDGLAADQGGNVYVTDVDNSAVLRLDSAGRLQTIVRSPRIRWADSLAFGPGGWLYLSDSALAETLLQTRRTVDDRAPYRVLRFRPAIATAQAE